jgi:hypothetical protein
MENSDKLTRSSPHLVRKAKGSLYKTPLGKIVIYVMSACPELRPYGGVFHQYLITLDISIHAEGEHAVRRYKSYKAEFLRVVASGYLPKRKFRHVMPILKLALQYRSDNFVLAMIHTVLRSYDLYMPTQKASEKALESFYEEYMTHEPPKPSQLIVKLEDEVLNFNQAIQDLVYSPEFESYGFKQLFDEPFRPEEKAILLTKRGTAKPKSRSFPVKGYAPAIVGATAELVKAQSVSFNSAFLSYYDELSQLGNLIGKRSFPSMKMISETPPLGDLEGELRRHAVIPSPGFKSRVIAVGDYTTQYVLSPIHRWAFKCLSRIRSDYTFDHSKGFQVLNALTESEENIACFDLSQATDNFPVEFSTEVLRLVMPGGEDIAPLWRDVMVGVPFKGNQYYRVGQPMGLLSSWAVFALSHHFLIWIAALKAGILPEVLQRPEKAYGEIGDDLFVVSQPLAHYYVMYANALGLKINPTKSLYVSKTQRVSEFAHRNSFNGREITALSPNLIVKSFDDYPCFRELILKSREICVSDASFYDEATVIDMVTRFGGRFISHAISTLATVPVVYAGLSPMEKRGIWPPLARFSMLAMKVLEVLDLNLRGIYISSSGRDVYNDLVQWARQDYTLPGTFSRTQFYEFLRKQSSVVDDVIVKPGGLRDILVEYLFSISDNVLDMTEEEFAFFEDDLLHELERYAQLPILSVKEVVRKIERIYAFRIYKACKAYPVAPDSLRLAVENTVNSLKNKLEFKFPQGSTPFSSFGEVETD